MMYFSDIYHKVLSKKLINITSYNMNNFMDIELEKVCMNSHACIYKVVHV